VRTIATEFRDRRHREERKHRLNREIMAPEVRLSGPDNEPLGIVPLQEALRMAGELDVDLVEIAATATPPVCRLMDYGKFKYLEQKKAAEAKAKQTVIEIKEVKFRPGTTTATTTSSCATSADSWPMATSARSRCVSAAVKSRTSSWVWTCSTVCVTIWRTPSRWSSSPSWKAARW
jgi:hypothetical protein